MALRCTLDSTISRKISKLPKGLRTRFAPSPTGFLHLGHVASAIYVWGIARAVGAEIVLRMEDHDQGRVRAEFEESILEDLQWLGFQADLGVRSSAHSDFRQSDHWNRYEERLSRLDIYHCNCSRREILERVGQVSSELLYDGYCRTRDFGPNLRMKIEAVSTRFEDLCIGEQVQVPLQQCGDLLVKDRDGQWTYNYAVAVDDVEEKISLIIRGQDILPSTGRQIILRENLGVRSQPYYFHHPLIMADAEKKLSKRDRATSIGQLRSSGLSAEEVIGKAALLVGLQKEYQPIRAQDASRFFV